MTKDMYRKMTYEEFHRYLVTQLDIHKRAGLERALHLRQNVLPALAAMKEMTAKPGARKDIKSGEVGWQDECYLLEISAELVRKWKQKTASEAEILALLEEPKKKKKEAKPKSNAAMVRMLAVKLAKAVCSENNADAIRLALEILEMEDKDSLPRF